MVSSLLLPSSIQVEVKRNLVGYWPTALNGAVDLRSAFGPFGPLDLTNNGTVTRVAGVGNNVPDATHYVVASTQSLSKAIIPNLQPRNQPFAIACWAKADGVAAAGTRMMMSQYGAAGNRAWTLFQTNSTLRTTFAISIDGTALIQPTSPVEDAIANGSWAFYVGSYDGARAMVQTNMRSIVAAAGSGSVFNSTAAFSISNAVAAGNLWSGDIGPCYMWIGRIPSQKELFWLYNNGQGRDLIRGV